MYFKNLKISFISNVYLDTKNIKRDKYNILKGKTQTPTSLGLNTEKIISPNLISSRVILPLYANRRRGYFRAVFKGSYSI